MDELYHYGYSGARLGFMGQDRLMLAAVLSLGCCDFGFLFSLPITLRLRRLFFRSDIEIRSPRYLPAP